ncbi:MAG: hypothetical protein EZS28_023968 [Streblomastix strix]|uniref:Uncharacterized protein n=1 Tax=Streblomastix strix TaxID=222440 RepID=A0A5J4VDF3_9EUKA|nr:MAG: hypothetical protein EZS28_023968 [Streblomastix strix]
MLIYSYLLKARQLCCIFLIYEMSYEIGSVYLDEALLEAAGLLKFPEYYSYIIERDQEPVPPAQRIPIGEQTLQKQVKNNDDILFRTNEVFVPQVSNAPTKLDLSSQLERSSFLASSESDPQLIVYGDRVTLTASYETTGLIPNEYLFKSYPEFARLKEGDKVIAIVGRNATNKNSIFCYIDQNGPFIINTSQIPSTTGLFINITYFKKYEQSKKINYDANNDGIVNITDTWHVNGKGSFETSSHIYETVKKQTDLIVTGLFGDVKVNYLNCDIKLQDKLAVYKADRAAFFIKEGPFITFNFVRTEQQECAAMCLFKDLYDKSLAVEVTNPTSNEELNALSTDPKEHDSHIDEVIIKNDGKLASSISIFTITNVFKQIQLIAPFDQGGHAYKTYYIIDDGTCKVCIFNLYFETKRIASSIQEIGLLQDTVLPTDGKRIFSKLKKLVSVVGKGVSWMNDKIVKPIKPIINTLLSSLGPAGSMVAKGISVGSSAVDALFGPNKQQSKQQFRQDFKTLGQDDYLRRKVPIDIISNRIKLIGDELQ